MGLKIIHLLAVGDLFANGLQVAPEVLPYHGYIAGIEPVVIDGYGVGQIPHLMEPATGHENSLIGPLIDGVISDIVFI